METLAQIFNLLIGHLVPIVGKDGYFAELYW